MEISTESVSAGLIAAEARQRRTFAIISHPDAGKTTLTEKLLLYSGMIRTAGMVRGRKGSRSTSSDWMGMEQERGISITASAMQFPYKNCIINLLDTPGHQDFSEDTYRTLMAADSAIMVIDSVKGVELQTRKLFAVCRMRGIPVLTFINKMDLPGKDPLDLIQEVEEVLSIKGSPRNWPIGQGRAFAGVADVDSKAVHLFTRSEIGGSGMAGHTTTTLEAAREGNLIDPELLAKLADDVALLREAGNPYSKEAFLKGEITPVFFGSAITNFGVEPFLDQFVEIAPSPGPRKAFRCDAKGNLGEEFQVKHAEQPFSAFVFKIQANMNPKHRDSLAFMRICSGKFERDMMVWHQRLGKEIRLSRSHSMLARDRQTVDEAFPGDVVGVLNRETLAIGDTISIGGGFVYEAMPQFPPELVARVRPKDVNKRKSFDKGMKQLASEGAMQLLYSIENPYAEPMIAVVGKLQFDVLEYRLRDEYTVEVEIDQLPFQCTGWLLGDVASFKKPFSSQIVKDSLGRPVVLFASVSERNYSRAQNKGHQILDFGPAPTIVA